MPWIFLLAFAVFAPIFFRYPAHTPELSGGFAITHVYDLEKDASLPGPEEQWNGVIKPFPSFDGDRSLKQSTGTAVHFPGSDLAFAPFLGRGYFRYQKVGKEISFYSETGELMWRKPFQSYPVSDVQGQVVLLLTGDNNRVEIIDNNGNSKGSGHVSGNFMTDLCFPSRAPGAGVVFSAGAVHLIDGEGRAVTLNYDGKRPLFIKSCSVFPDGSGLAVHMLEGENDRITVFTLKKGKLVEDYEPPEPCRSLIHACAFCLERGPVFLLWRAGVTSVSTTCTDQSVV
ncbi:MAG: hypothetical protein HY042_10590 [Spirochaetia bacterium]|nr:hypothetical protein [Spirochaetia bacterium]